MSPRLLALNGGDYQNGGNVAVALKSEKNGFIAINSAPVLNNKHKRATPPPKLSQKRYSPNFYYKSNTPNGFTHSQKPQKNAVKKSGCKRYSPQEMQKLTDVFYAGAKFCDHPSPSQLPKPPLHWITGRCNSANGDLVQDKDHCDELSMQLKMLLKVEG